MSSCAARCLVWSSRTSPHGTDGIADCGRPAGHGGVHRGQLDGAVTVVSWMDEDRRTFTGQLLLCDQTNCILPAGHHGRHAT